MRIEHVLITKEFFSDVLDKRIKKQYPTAKIADTGDFRVYFQLEPGEAQPSNDELEAAARELCDEEGRACPCRFDVGQSWRRSQPPQ